MENQMNIFEMYNKKGNIYTPDRLNIVKAKFINEEKISWEELFEGYDELYAITFSSGIQFMGKLFDKFHHIEVIFGCEEILDFNLATIMAVERASIENIIHNKAAILMSEKMEQGKLNLYVSRDMKSHEKLFILKANDGRVRVITGSANMSANAFCGVQRENILCFDDNAAFDYYKNQSKYFETEEEAIQLEQKCNKLKSTN